MLIKPSKKDVIWSYVGIIMSMASNFLLLPFLMHFIESDFLGLWYVYLSLGGIVVLFDFGFNPTFARNIAYCWSGASRLSSEGVIYSQNNQPNYGLMRKVIKTCQTIYLIISLIALFVLLTVGSVYIYFISTNIFNNSVIISWIIYSVAVFLNLYYGYYATFLRGVGAVSQYNKINVMARLAQIVISILLLIWGWGIIGVSIAYLLYGFILRFFSKQEFYRHQDLGVRLKEHSEEVSAKDIKELFCTVWHNAWRDGIVAVSNYCAGQASTLIASTVLSLTETGIYSISVQLITAIATIAAGLYTAYQPAMQSAYANNNVAESRRLMSLAMVTYNLLFWGGTIGLMIIGIPILKVVKPDYVYDKLVILGIAIYNFFYKRQTYYASFISNTNRVPYMLAYIISSISGIVASIVLVCYLEMGVWGLIIGQFVPQLVYNCWKWPLAVYKMLGIKGIKFAVIGVKELKTLIVRRIS